MLGSILIDGECLTRLAPLLKERDFYRERNQICFDAAMALFQRDQAVDQVTLAGELQRTERLDLVGGMAYLSHLVSITPTSVHAEDYAQVISRTSNMRRLIDAGNRIVELGYDDTEDLEATMRQAEDALFTVRGAGQSRGFVPSKGDIRPVPAGAGVGRGRRSEFSGTPIMSGFPDLDECLGGLQRADLVILGARPSMGKSSLAVNMAINAAKSGQTCGVFSLEMTREQLAMRILASEAGIDSHRLRLGLYTHLEENRIIDSIGKSVRSSGVHRRHPVPGHGRDAGQGQEAGPRAGAGPAGGRLPAAGAGEAEVGTVQPGAGDNRDLPGTEGAGQRSQGRPHRLLATEPGWWRTGRTTGPSLSDLRDSGSIEQDADVVMFIHREDVHTTEEEWTQMHPGQEYPKNIAELIIAKHRKGPTGSIRLEFVDNPGHGSTP